MSNEYQLNAHLSNDDADEFIKENPYNFNEEEINVQKILKSMLNQTLYGKRFKK